MKWVHLFAYQLQYLCPCVHGPINLMPHFHYNHCAGISLLPLFKLSVPPLFILHNWEIFWLLFLQMGSRKIHRNLWKKRWEVGWATCYQQSVSLPSLPSQGSQEYGWKFPATIQCQFQVTARPSSTKNAGTLWRIKKKCECTSLRWIFMLLFYYSNGFRKLETEHLLSWYFCKEKTP